MCAALAAARHGAQVVLMQDRAVLGGNASSECRVGISGAARGGIPHMRETGILEELRLENLYRNPHDVFAVQDTVYYEKVRFEPNITLLMNCTCTGATMDGSLIASISGWQMSSETQHVVNAGVFADCSGDSILAPLTGAEYRVGREARSEFGESIAPEHADGHTMGMSLLFKSRHYDTPQPFEPPDWAYRFERCEDLPYGERGHDIWPMGYWWIELGGEQDSIHDSEAIRDELLRIVYGVWDHLKNHCRHKDRVTNDALDWIGFVPGKRESRRYVGDHIVTENDIRAEGRFRDMVAYGGWTMDDHDPAGFWSVRTPRPSTVFHPCPSPYGIPYRAMYSRNIDNLMFAGRNISCTHAAMSSTRVMATCAVIGQAVGTAAAIASERGIAPRQVGEYIHELQQRLLRDDCYLPWVAQEFGPLTSESGLVASVGDPEPLRDGTSRQVADDAHCWTCSPGDWAEYRFPTKAHVRDVSLVLDSDLSQRMASHWGDGNGLAAIPPEMPRRFHVDALVSGEWRVVQREENNHHRFVRLPVEQEAEGVRFVLDETWGADKTRIYAFYVD